MAWESSTMGRSVSLSRRVVSSSFDSTTARDTGTTRQRRFVGVIDDNERRREMPFEDERSESAHDFRVYEGRRDRDTWGSSRRERSESYDAWDDDADSVAGSRGRSSRRLSRDRDDASSTSRFASAGLAAAGGVRAMFGGRDGQDGRDEDRRSARARRDLASDVEYRSDEGGSKDDKYDAIGHSFDAIGSWEPSSLGVSRRRFAGVIDDRDDRDGGYGRSESAFDDEYEDDEFDEETSDWRSSRRSRRNRDVESSSSRRGSSRSAVRFSEASKRTTRNGKRPLLFVVADAPGGVARGAVGFFNALRSHVMVVAALVAIVFAVVQAYGPVRDYYLARRKEEVLAATYDALELENDQLRDDVARLQTKEGIEDEAHRHGYVHQGEVRVVVDDLNENDVDDWKLDATGEVEVVEEREWYIEKLDEFFGFDPAEQ